MDNEDEFGDYQDEGFYTDAGEDEPYGYYPDDLGWDPYSGTYMDDDPVDPYED